MLTLIKPHIPQIIRKIVYINVLECIYYTHNSNITYIFTELIASSQCSEMSQHLKLYFSHA